MVKRQTETPARVQARVNYEAKQKDMGKKNLMIHNVETEVIELFNSYCSQHDLTKPEAFKVLLLNID